jgi:hypothetical protein
MSTITCTDVNQFVEVIARLVREGVVFRADGRELRIVLTGGY